MTAPASAILNTIPNLVIGGGPAGSMVAIRLASAGHPVLLLERERTAHHKVCGEFLSREAVDYLREAGVDPILLGADPIRYLRFSSQGTTVRVAPAIRRPLPLSLRVG